MNTRFVCLFLFFQVSFVLGGSGIVEIVDGLLRQSSILV